MQLKYKAEYLITNGLPWGFGSREVLFEPQTHVEHCRNIVQQNSEIDVT